MDKDYFNYSLKTALSRWEIAGFWRAWRRIAHDDRFFIPPYYPAFQNLTRGQVGLRFYTLEALHRERIDYSVTPGGAPQFVAPHWPEPVATVIVWPVPRQPETALLCALQSVNNVEALEHLLELVAENCGIQQFLAPGVNVPFLPGGALSSHWHEPTPVHAPYSPPFLVELLHEVMHPAGTSTLYWADIPSTQLTDSESGPAELQPLDLSALATRWASLWSAVYAESLTGVIPPADILQLANYLVAFPTWGWLATVNAEPAGFVLMQPDLAPRLHRSGGGWYPWWRAWFHWAKHRPVKRGRLLIGGVLPRLRGQGIGRQLWAAALRTGREQGWQQLVIGPVGENQPGNQFLQAQNAQPRQKFELFSWNAPQSGGFWW